MDSQRREISGGATSDALARRRRMDAIVLQYALRQPLIHCTLTGVTSCAQIEANLRATTAALPDGIWDELMAHGFCRPCYSGQPAVAQEPST